METQQLTTEVKLDPETLAFAQTYLSTLDIDQTAHQLCISKEQAMEYLRKNEVKRFIDNVFLEQGYINKFKLQDLLSEIVEAKLEEARETGIFTNKDLLDVLALLHKIHMDHAKLNKEEGPKNQTNVQVNNYNNLGALIDKIVNNGN